MKKISTSAKMAQEYRQRLLLIQHVAKEMGTTVSRRVGIPYTREELIRQRRSPQPSPKLSAA